MRKKIILLVLAVGIMFLLTTCDTVENGIDKPNFKGKVVYVTHYDDSQKTELTIMNIDGSNKRVIDTSEKFYIREPNWSKDGKTIIYVGLSGWFGGRLSIISENGTGKEFLQRKNNVGFVSEIISGDMPRFSPNGEFFVYNSIGDPGAFPIVNKLFEWSEKWLLEIDDANDVGQKPWFSDGKRVIISAKIKNEQGLYVIDFVSDNYEKLAVAQQSFQRPILSPDEKDIIYSTTSYGGNHYGSLFQLNINTKEITKLSFSITGLKIMFPKYWTKDKRYLLFIADNDDERMATCDLLYHDFITGKTDYLLKNISYDIDVWLEE